MVAVAAAGTAQRTAVRVCRLLWIGAPVMRFSGTWFGRSIGPWVSGDCRRQSRWRSWWDGSRTAAFR